jgi:fucose 4-O-acetylase-like acetyltransferase
MVIGAGLREAVEKTPEDRERHADLLRAVAISMVVLGHWLVIAVTEANDEIDGVNALRDLQWIHPLTWLFQVMPVFFFVGGYANAVSWRSHRNGGGDTTSWVLGRYERLIHPAAALLGVLVLAVLGAQVAGFDQDLAATGAWLATVPLWFLLAYLAIISVTPLTIAMHDRWGLWVPIVLLAVAIGADVLRFGAELPVVGNVNYVVVWLCLHQLGYSWRDGQLPAVARVGWPLLIGGFTVLVLLTRFGPYPISVVTAPGQDEQNTEPPTVAILALGTAQLGLAYVLRAPLHGWLQRRRPWMAVVAVNSVILTLFLWHMAAAIGAALLLYGTGLIPVVEVGSAEWFALRVPWLVGCALLLGILTAVFSVIERRVIARSRSGDTTSGLATDVGTWAAVVALLAGMLGIAVAGPGSNGPLGLPIPALGAFAVGVLLLTAAGRNIGGDHDD